MTADKRRDPKGVAELIRRADSVAVCGHVNPDGDAVGSALAMYHGLKKQGKKVQVFFQDKIPDNLHCLPGVDTIKNPETEPDTRYDLLLCVDTSDVYRMGSCSALKDRCDAWAQIDHHGTNPDYAQENDVDGRSPANCILIREVLKELGISLDRDIAMCLYAGLSTDTGNFAFASTNAETFDIMSELMEQGLPLQDMNRVLFREKAKAQVLLMGRAIAGLEFRCDGKLAVMTLSEKDFTECGALSEHADTIVNVGLDTIGTCMAVLCREAGDGIKVSLRAVPPHKVDGIAQQFGGGGHPQAAGIMMKGALAEVTQKVTTAMEAALIG